MKKLSLIIGLAFLLIPAFLGLKINAQELQWTEVQPAGDENRNWIAVDVSFDGNKLIAIDFGGRMYMSSDAGQMWNEVTPTGNATNLNWYSMDMSDDGETIIAAITGGLVYMSIDGGENWTVTYPTGFVQNRNWQSVAVSGDGNFMFASQTNTGRIYMSSDKGEQWEEIQPAGSAVSKWWVAGVDFDGSTILVTDGDYTGNLYLSTDSGDNWDATIPAVAPGEGNWYYWPIAVNSNGSKMLVGVYDGRLYYSENSGTDWAEFQPSGNAIRKWNTTSMSADGSKLLAGIYNGRLYFSTNSGELWNEIQPGGDVNRNWYDTSMSSSGNIVIVADYGGRLYVGSIPTPTPTPTSTPIPTAVPTTTPTSTPQNPVTITVDKIGGTEVKEGSSIHIINKNHNITISGFAVPFSKLTITVKSDPKVCETMADSNGYYTCTIPYIEDGYHEVEIVAITPDDEVITYPKFTLGVNVSLSATGNSMIISPAVGMALMITGILLNVNLSLKPKYKQAIQN